MNLRGCVSLDAKLSGIQVQPGNPSDNLHELLNDGQSGLRGNSYTMESGDLIERLRFRNS